MIRTHGLGQHPGFRHCQLAGAERVIQPQARPEAPRAVRLQVMGPGPAGSASGFRPTVLEQVAGRAIDVRPFRRVPVAHQQDGLALRLRVFQNARHLVIAVGQKPVQIRGLQIVQRGEQMHVVQQQRPVFQVQAQTQAVGAAQIQGPASFQRYGPARHDAQSHIRLRV